MWGFVAGARSVSGKTDQSGARATKKAKRPETSLTHLYFVSIKKPRIIAGLGLARDRHRSMTPGVEGMATYVAGGFPSYGM